MEKDSEKRAIVTGGTGQIGESIARSFACIGMRVVMAGRQENLGHKMARSIGHQGGRVIFSFVDVTSPASVKAMVNRSLDWMGGVDILVNSAGVLSYGTIDELSEAQWDYAMDTNAKGTFLCSREVIPIMTRGGGGCIINIGSLGGLHGFVGGSAYSSSKAAVGILTKVMALEHGKNKIRVNCIAPGTIMPSRPKRAIRRSSWTNEARRVPLGRLGTPEDIASTALFLSSENSSFISGAIIVVDGGQSAGQFVY